MHLQPHTHWPVYQRLCMARTRGKYMMSSHPFRQTRAGDQERIYTDPCRDGNEECAQSGGEQFAGRILYYKGVWGHAPPQKFWNNTVQLLYICRKPVVHIAMNDELIIFSWIICWYLYHLDNCGRSTNCYWNTPDTQLCLVKFRLHYILYHGM